MRTKTNSLFIIVFLLSGVVNLNWGFGTIQFTQGHDDAGLFIGIAGIVQIIAASVVLHLASHSR